MTEFDANSVLIRRDHVIIGWREGEWIRPLSNLFGETNRVYDRRNHMLVRLQPAELRRLGVNRPFALVLANDEAAAARRRMLQENHPENHQVNQQAIHEVNQQAIHQANPQENHEVNQEAYRIYRDYLLNNETAAVHRPVPQAILQANREAHEIYQDYLRRSRHNQLN